MSDRRFWRLLLLLLFAAQLAAILHRPLHVSHDGGMYVQAGELLLVGKTPYVDFIDINPPLILYLSAIPVLLGRLLPFPAITTFLLLVWALTLASVLATRRMLLATLPPQEHVFVEWLAAALAAGSAGLFLTTSFGQREHLFLLGFLPFVALRFRRWEGAAVPRGAAVAAGVVAGLFACLKPHFFLIVAAPEIYWLAIYRRRRTLLAPETIALCATAVVYGAHFLFLPEPMKSAFLHEVLPLTARGYGTYSRPLASLLANVYIWPGILAFAAAFLLAPQRAAAAWRVIRAFGAAGLGATFVFLLQSKGWPYHAIPGDFALVAVLAMLGAQLHPLAFAADAADGAVLRLRIPRRFVLQTIGALTALACLAGLRFAFETNLSRQFKLLADNSVLAKIIDEHSREGDPVLMISTEVVPAYPMLAQMRRPPGSRFFWFYWIPMVQQGVGLPGANAAQLEARYLEQLAQDIRTRRPPLILVAKGPCWNCPQSSTVYGYLKDKGFYEHGMYGYAERDARAGMAIFLPRNGAAPKAN